MWESPKCDIEWTNAIGNMVLIDLLDAVLLQTFDLLKNALAGKRNKAKHNEVHAHAIFLERFWKDIIPSALRYSMSAVG